MTTVTEAPASAPATQPAAPCPITPWCCKGDGHPADPPNTWSPCATQRQLYPTTNHDRPIGYVYGETDGDLPMAVVEHADEGRMVALLLNLDEVDELITALQATRAAVKASPDRVGSVSG